MDAHIQKKYPNVLITDDYRILNENDLAAYTQKMVGRISFAESEKHNHGYEYWQCFPKENISIHISTAMDDRDIDAPANAVKVEMMGRIKIEVHKKNTIHRYTLRRDWAVFNALTDFTDWYSLIRKEKYVCLGGDFVSVGERTIDGKKKKVYGWIFDKIKTKNGCLSYFSGDCDRTYAQHNK